MLKKLTGLEFAYQCPYCFHEGFTSLERQEFELVDNILTILHGFECMNCCDNWEQEIIFELSNPLKNHLTYPKSD